MVIFIERFYFICNFLIFLIDHFVQFPISYKLKALVLNIWELIFDKRRGRSHLLLLKMLLSCVAYLLWTMTGTNLWTLLMEFLLLYRRILNCTTVVQIASYLFFTRNLTKFAQKMTLFGSLLD